MVFFNLVANLSERIRIVDTDLLHKYMALNIINGSVFFLVLIMIVTAIDMFLVQCLAFLILSHYMLFFILQ